jgi:hypothetical protein
MVIERIARPKTQSIPGRLGILPKLGQDAGHHLHGQAPAQDSGPVAGEQHALETQRTETTIDNTRDCWVSTRPITPRAG